MNENQNIEYKQCWRDEYLKWICGFANANGGRRKVFEELNPQATVPATEPVTVPVSEPVTIPVIMGILHTKEYVDSLISLFSQKAECSSNEIMGVWGLSSLRYVRTNYINPLVKAGILKLKYPDIPNHRQQRYLLNKIK